ncbi:SpoIIE family protein phosphatase [Spirochaetota bacterium]
MENDKKDIINILTKIQIFKGLEEEELEEIVHLLEPKLYKPDITIFKQGSKGNSMYIIKKGTVNVSKIAENNEKIDIVNLYSGSIFGEFALIDRLPRSANIVTLEETEIFRLKKNDFDKLLQKNKKIANVFYKNCLKETFSRFRNILANFTFSQHTLKVKTDKIIEIDKDLSHAKQIQDFFISTDYLDGESDFSDGLRQSFIYEPCIAIGGDFLNVIKIDDDNIGIIIADVEGHGITAALGTGVLRSALSIILKDLGNKPAELLYFLNNHFCDVLSQLFATCYYAIINKKEKKITFSKAGHPQPLFWKKSLNDFETIDAKGPGLGILADAKFNKVEFDIEKGDKILFFTDGIIEQLNCQNEMFQESRLKENFENLIDDGEKDIVNKLFGQLKEFTGEKDQEDDVTLFLLEIE